VKKKIYEAEAEAVVVVDELNLMECYDDLMKRNRYRLMELKNWNGSSNPRREESCE